MNEKLSPKAFISYSWTTSDHEQWVIDLATELVESGIEVLLDKWDLREGADKYVYMEKMVNDPDVKKVIMICDKAYVEKANKRKGGVGTETQIITPELYEKVEPEGKEQKFVAVVLEFDENGYSIVPTYYKGRIHIDMSNEEKRNKNFEHLVRWVFDKPLYIKPKIGNPPAYLDESKLSLGTTASYNRVMDSLRQGKSNSLGTIDEFFETVVENYELLRIERANDKQFDDQLIDNIKSFLLYRDQIIDVLLAISKYLPTESAFKSIHNFFERLVPFNYLKAPKTSYMDTDFDNFRFLSNELFLYAIAAFLKYDLFNGAYYLYSQLYYFTDIRGSQFKNFIIFRNNIISLDDRNRRLHSGRPSMHADLLKVRAYRNDVPFEQLMQADFFSYLYACLYDLRWRPETLIYTTFDFYRPFEKFARASSKQFFNKLIIAFGIEGIEPLNKLVDGDFSNYSKVPSWQHEYLAPNTLMNSDKLATMN